jgi:hypothetical protein
LWAASLTALTVLCTTGTASTASTALQRERQRCRERGHKESRAGAREGGSTSAQYKEAHLQVEVGAVCELVGAVRELVGAEMGLLDVLCVSWMVLCVSCL